jgi:hypothetical protein
MTEALLGVGEFLALPRSDSTRLGTFWRIEEILSDSYRLVRVGFVRKTDEPYGYDPANLYRIERRKRFIHICKKKHPFNEMHLLAVLTDSIDRGANYL